MSSPPSTVPRRPFPGSRISYGAQLVIVDPPEGTLQTGGDPPPVKKQDSGTLRMVYAPADRKSCAPEPVQFIVAAVFSCGITFGHAGGPIPMARAGAALLDASGRSVRTPIS